MKRRGDWGLLSMQSKCIWLRVEEETAVSNKWIGCNLKPFRGHTFMASTKNHQICDPRLLHLQKWTIDILFKNKTICKHVSNFKTPSPTALPCGCHKYMLPYVFPVIWVFFAVLEKLPSCCLNETRTVTKILLKGTSKPWNCGSSNKVNSIIDGILWNFIWQNRRDVYYTKKNLLNLQNLVFSEISGDPYCNRNVNSGTETYATNLIFM